MLSAAFYASEHYTSGCLSTAGGEAQEKGKEIIISGIYSKNMIVSSNTGQLEAFRINSGP